MGVKHTVDSIMTEGFLKSVFHSKTNPLRLVWYKESYANREVYVVKVYLWIMERD